MEQYHSLEEVTEKYIGVKGSTERTAFEAEVEAALIGSTIKDVRKSRTLIPKR
jgi:hypothetical protein